MPEPQIACIVTDSRGKKTFYRRAMGEVEGNNGSSLRIQKGFTTKRRLSLRQGWASV